MQVILFEQIKACVRVCDECECFYLRMGVARVFVHLSVQVRSGSCTCVCTSIGASSFALAWIPAFMHA